MSFRKLYLVSLIAIFAMMLPLGNSSEASEGETMSQREHFFVKLLGTRVGWPENMTAAEEKIMGEHFQYLKDLVARKKVLFAGPVFSSPPLGIVVLQTSNIDEATEIMKQEPSVVQGVHTYEIVPMVASLMVDYRSPDRYAAKLSDRILRKEIVVAASLEDVWNAWTTTEGVKSFFSMEGKVGLSLGGPYEIAFDSAAPYGSQGSEDCRVLSFIPMEMLSFEWNAPPDFGELRFKKTQVILRFEQVAPNSVKVNFSQLGWGSGEEWDKLYAYFDRAWSFVLGNLEKRFVSGPIDWTK